MARVSPPLFPLGSRTLEAVSHCDFEPLVSAAAFDDAAQCAAQFSIPSHTVCFESRLAADDPRVDVAFGICAEPNLGGYLLDLHERFGNAPGWAQFSSFMRVWTTPGSPLIWQVPFVCVAFDLPAPLERRALELPVPQVSLCVDPSFFLKRMGLQPALTMTLEELKALTRATYTILAARTLDARADAHLSLLLASNHVEAKHISVMIARPGAPLKVDVRLRSEDVVAYLEYIGWPGSALLIQRELHRLAPWAGHLQLNLVAHPVTRPVLEVELLSGEPVASAHERLAFLERLVELGVCAETKARVLAEVSAHPIETDVTGFSLARNWYVKLRFASDRLQDAKAYLGLMPRLSLGSAEEFKAAGIAGNIA